jgi:hypothetical protein
VVGHLKEKNCIILRSFRKMLSWDEGPLRIPHFGILGRKNGYLSARMFFRPKHILGSPIIEACASFRNIPAFLE